MSSFSSLPIEYSSRKQISRTGVCLCEIIRKKIIMKAFITIAHLLLSPWPEQLAYSFTDSWFLLEGFNNKINTTEHN